MLGYSDNPHGHWESRSLSRYNDRLLHLMHSAWDCPPSTGDTPSAVILREQVGPGRLTFESLHPTARWACKDPRLCILMPFWRRALPGPHVAVLVLRHPLEVTESLVRRDHIKAPHVRALWERYLRLALVSCARMPVLVIEYADVVEDPLHASSNIAQFLTEYGPPIDGSQRAAADFIRTELRHHVQSETSLEPLSDEQRQLWSLARSLKGVHSSFDELDLPPESPEATAIMNRLRRTWGYPPALVAGNRAQCSSSSAKPGQAPCLRLEPAVGDLAP
jgi:hypothetical protein